MPSPIARIRRLNVERQAQLASAAVYGTVIMLAALAGVSISDVVHGVAVELVIGVGFATWIAHLFAELIGEHLLKAHAPEERDLKIAVIDATPVLLATVLPALAVGMGHAKLIDDRVSIWVAVGIGIAQLLAICIAVGSISGDRRDAMRYGLAATVIGVVIVVVKITLGQH